MHLNITYLYNNKYILDNTYFNFIYLNKSTKHMIKNNCKNTYAEKT